MPTHSHCPRPLPRHDAPRCEGHSGPRAAPRRRRGARQPASWGFEGCLGAPAARASLLRLAPHIGLCKKHAVASRPPCGVAGPRVKSTAGCRAAQVSSPAPTAGASRESVGGDITLMSVNAACARLTTDVLMLIVVWTHKRSIAGLDLCDRAQWGQFRKIYSKKSSVMTKVRIYSAAHLGKLRSAASDAARRARCAPLRVHTAGAPPAKGRP